jgi:hypothetical protein
VAIIVGSNYATGAITVADISRTRRNTLERKCLPKALKRLFKGSTKGTFKMLEKVKPTKNRR